jgi:hypothetical protein
MRGIRTRSFEPITNASTSLMFWTRSSSADLRASL